VLYTKNEYLKGLDMHIGKKLRERRNKLHFTLSQVADALGMSHQQIQKYEQAQNRVSAAILFQLSQFYGVAPQFFYQGFSLENCSSKKMRTNQIFHDPQSEIKILLAENDPIDVQVLRNALDSCDRKISSYSLYDGDQVINYLKYKKNNDNIFEKPDLILLSVDLSKRDGLIVLKELKRDKSTQNIPVVMLTNKINQEEIELIYGNSAAGYFLKTTDQSQVNQKMRYLIDYWCLGIIIPGLLQESDGFIYPEESDNFPLSPSGKNVDVNDCALYTKKHSFSDVRFYRNPEQEENKRHLHH